MYSSASAYHIVAPSLYHTLAPCWSLQSCFVAAVGHSCKLALYYMVQQTAREVDL